MRNLFFFICFAFCFNFLQSQTLTQSFNEPVVTEVDKNYRLDTSAYASGLPNNISGSNVIWDFTQVTGAFPILFDSVINPTLAPTYTVFPQSTYAIRRGTLNTFYKSTTSPSQTELLGLYSPTLSLTFTNTAILLQYPVNFGYSNSDVISGFYSTGTNTGAVNGNITVVADGIGTLNLPDNLSFQNVLRIKSVEQITLSATVLPLGTIKQTIYSYFVPGKKYPVIYVQYNSYQFLAGTPIITVEVSGDFDYFYVVGLQKNNHPFKQVQVVPNPFSEELKILGTESLGAAHYQLLGPDGRILLKGKSLEELNGLQLAKGSYFLEISDGTNTFTKKIIKE